MDLVEQFSKVRHAFIEMVSGFPEERVNDTVCGTWDIRCVLSHIAGWDAYFTLMAKLLKEDKEIPYKADKIEMWNKTFVEERKDNTWEQIKQEFVEEGQKLIDEYSSLEGDIWNRLFWEDRRATPAWMLNHNAEHYKVHMDGILKKLKA